MLSLCCISANTLVDIFSVEKVIVFDFFLLGHDSLLHHMITHIYMLLYQQNTVYGVLLPCVDCSCWVLHNALVSAASSPTTPGHPVVLFLEKGHNYEGAVQHDCDILSCTSCASLSQFAGRVPSNPVLGQFLIMKQYCDGRFLSKQSWLDCKGCWVLH